MAEERPQDCVSRTLYASAAGAGFGAVFGAITANWSDVPKVIRNKSWPAFKQTGLLMVAQGGVFAALGAAYAVGDCVSESLRGEKDKWNGVVGGLAAGAVIGLRAGSVPAAVGSAVALGSLSAIVELAAQRPGERGIFDDGLTPPPNYYPYPQRPSGGE